MRRYHPIYENRLIQMIDSIYQEYGDVIYFPGADRDLLNIEKYYLPNGEFWIETAKDDNQKIIGSIAVKQDVDNKYAAWLKRFYLRREYRNSGLAQKMHDHAIGWCKLNSMRKVHLWSDTRFRRSHKFYQKNHYEQKGMRNMNDRAITYQEYYFVKAI